MLSGYHNIYCLNELLDDTVFGSTTLAGCRGGHMTCLAAACFAASFHIIPVVAFSTCCLVNGSITSETHSEVRPVCTLSHWRTFASSSVPSFHLGHVVGALNHIQPSLLFGSVRIGSLGIVACNLNPRDICEGIAWLAE